MQQAEGTPPLPQPLRVTTRDAVVPEPTLGISHLTWARLILFCTANGALLEMTTGQTTSVNPTPIQPTHPVQRTTEHHNASKGHTTISLSNSTHPSEDYHPIPTSLSLKAFTYLSPLDSKRRQLDNVAALILLLCSLHKTV